jgi:hypothetical protein
MLDWWSGLFLIFRTWPSRVSYKGKVCIFPVRTVVAILRKAGNNLEGESPVSVGIDIEIDVTCASATTIAGGVQEDYLIQNRYRCVIIGKFDIDEANKRVRRDSDNAKDNDAYLLQDEAGTFVSN